MVVESDKIVDSKAKEIEFVDIIVKKIMDKVMGQCLDIVRIGIQTEHSLRQAERNIRQNFNLAREYLIKSLKDKIMEENNGIS